MYIHIETLLLLLALWLLITIVVHALKGSENKWLAFLDWLFGYKFTTADFVAAIVILTLQNIFDWPLILYIGVILLVYSVIAIAEFSYTIYKASIKARNGGM